jgi:hypothetical protein
MPRITQDRRLNLLHCLQFCSAPAMNAKQHGTPKMVQRVYIDIVQSRSMLQAVDKSQSHIIERRFNQS